MRVQVDPVPINREALPPLVRGLLDPATPPERRLLFARAVVPTGPGELVSGLLCLLDDPSQAVREAARASLDTLPEGLLQAAAFEIEEPGVLDRLVRHFFSKPQLVLQVLSNPNVADETFAFVASRGSDVLLERVAQAQVRLQRYPKVIEALYFNPEARMGLVSAVLEFAVRSGIDLSHIPGYEEILESIFGPQAVKKAPAPETQAPAQEATTPDVFEALQAVEAAPQEGLEAALDDEGFALLLQAASWEEGEQEEEGDAEKRKAIWAEVTRLPVPQKVRLALIGNEFIRSILIRDSRRVVYMSVLKSPAVQEKEIIAFAKDKALPDEVIRTIATNREWTKLYAVRHALVQNPKCPPVIALNFLKTLTPKDIKQISISHDVPGYIAKQAKTILQARETGQKV